jgi:hypothetical protein
MRFKCKRKYVDDYYIFHHFIFIEVKIKGRNAMPLQIDSSPNRDGELVNITTSYINGETLHLMSVEKDRAATALNAFKEAADEMQVNVIPNLGGVVVSGVLSMTFVEGADEKQHLENHIRDTLIRKSGVAPA